MKVKRNDTKHFQPITLEITIETEEELLELYARTNVNISYIQDATYERVPLEHSTTTKKLWETIQQICEERI